MSEELAVPIAQVRAAATELIVALRASGQVPGLQIDERAPDFELADAGGRPVRLADRLAAGPVVLSFYRGAWCPYCNVELRGLQTHLEQIHQRGASVIAISPQRPDDAAAVLDGCELGFDVLIDTNQQVSDAYRLRFELSQALQDIYPKLGIDLAVSNADGSWFLPVPATFVLDSAGVVRARHVEPDYTQRMDPADIVAALDQLTLRVPPLPSPT